MSVYFDNSATTKPLPQAVEAMVKAMTDGFYNPSAAYAPAMTAEKEVAHTRQLLADKLGVKKENVIFTSCGTEADKLAIMGSLCAMHKTGDILYTSVEHPAVRENCLQAAKQYGCTAKEIPVTKECLVDLDALEKLMTSETRLICVMQVNNETGAIEPIRQIAALRDRLCPGAVLHVDGVQGFLREPMHLEQMGVQTYALSGHKIGAPKGIGALAIAQGVRITPQLPGGGQEKGMRSGTENTPGIAGLGAAVEAYEAFDRGNQKMQAVKDRLLCNLASLPVHVNGPENGTKNAASHVLNVSLPPVRSETMLHALEGAGIYVSMGSACAAHKQKVSGVLKAMGVEKQYAESALRFSFCPDNTIKEADEAAKILIQNYELLSKYTRR